MNRFKHTLQSFNLHEGQFHAQHRLHCRSSRNHLRYIVVSRPALERRVIQGTGLNLSSTLPWHLGKGAFVAQGQEVPVWSLFAPQAKSSGAVLI
jgi:hypothetical protein